MTPRAHFTQLSDAELDEALRLLAAAKGMRAVLDGAAYFLSEPHLSGGRLIIGFSTKAEASEAHQRLANIARDGRDERDRRGVRSWPNPGHPYLELPDETLTPTPEPTDG